MAVSKPVSAASTPAGPPGAPIYAGYMALQAVLGVVQWALVALVPTVRSGFEVLADHRTVTNAFGVADVVAIGGSALTAWALARRRPWAVPVAAFTAGAVVYPTVFLIGWVAFAGATPTVALAVMIVVSTLTSYIAYQTWRAWRR